MIKLIIDMKTELSVSSFNSILEECGKDEIIRIIYLCTPFIRSSGDLEKMSNSELEFHWNAIGLTNIKKL